VNSLLWICFSISGVAALMLELLWMRSAGLVLGMGETTVIELVPEVTAAARSHFGIWNARLLERSNVRLVLDDGRRYLAVTPERFSPPSHR
jgi:spermidine synthase